MQAFVRIIGVGHEYRGDDATGLQVARKVRGLRLSGVQVLESAGDAGHLIELWQDPNPAIVIDAMHSGVAPGTIYRLEAGAHPLPAGYFPSHSTHSMGVAESIELARVLGHLPHRLIVYGIEGKSYELGAALSPEVCGALGEVVDRLLQDVQSLEAE